MVNINSSGRPDFRGLRVIAFESRMATETAALIGSFGGRPLVVPALREVPLEANYPALDCADELLAGDLDIIVFLTGIGARELLRAMETRYPRQRLLEALNLIVTVARGPKAVGALREFGLSSILAVPEPNTWREILALLSAHGELHGKRVIVQEYGVANRELLAGLEARGARVTAVPVYRWTLPEDQRPLSSAITSIAQNGGDVVLFTSSAQVTNVVQMAESMGHGEQFRERLRQLAVGSIGPICSAALRAHGLEPDFEPDHPKLGHLVKRAAELGNGIIQRKLRRPPVGLADPQPLRPVKESRPNPLSEHPMMRACRRQPVPYTPIWLMRQAGRYLPEYRRVRERHPFLEMCRRPELAAEVTVNAVERLGVDAAIIFADILLPLLSMDVGLRYESGDGPLIERPIRAAADLARVPAAAVAESLGFVAEAIRLVRRELAGKMPLIGFAGAPFTLASYLVEGGSSRQYQATKTLMYTDPTTWHGMMAMLAARGADYLNMQIEAGVDIVQIFDSWVGSLGPEDYRSFVLPHTRDLIAALPPGVPVIHFGTVTGNLLELMREAGGDVIGLDWRVDLGEAWARLGHGVAVQGNLDPVALFADVPELKRRAGEILAQAAGRPGHIFNLGHGLLPDTPVDHVIALVDTVHEQSSRRA